MESNKLRRRLVRPWWAIAACAVWLGACGDNLPGQATPDAGPVPEADAGPVCEPTVFPEPMTELTGPSALPTDGCDLSTLEGFDPVGLWIQRAEEGFSFGSMFQFVRACDGVLTMDPFPQTPDVFISESAEGIFVRFERSFGPNSFVQAGNICRRDPDGSLFGHEAFCFIDDMGPQCFPGNAFTMRPFSRIEDEPDADGLSLVATFQGTEEAPWPEDAIETNVRVVDGIAYLTSIADGLRIVDVSDPATPTEVGYFEAQADYYNDLKIVDGPGATRYALVAANDGVLVIDVTDPQAPTLVTVFSVPGMDFGMHTLFTEIVGGTTYAYIVDGATSLLGIFDITDPASPAMAGTFTIENEFGNIHDLFVEDGRVYLNAGLDGLIVVDTQPDPTTPVQVGQFLPAEPAYSHSNWVTTAGGRKISAHGDEGADTGLTIVDVDEASPEFMQPIGSFYLPNGASIHNIMAFGDRAYVAWYQNGVRVLDLSDPTNPTQVAHYNTWEAERGIRGLFDGTLGIDVDLAAGLIYAADTQLGLVILSIDQ